MLDRLRIPDVPNVERNYVLYSQTPIDRQAWYKSYIGEVAGLAVNRGLHIFGHFMGHNPHTIRVIT